MIERALRKFRSALRLVTSRLSVALAFLIFMSPDLYSQPILKVRVPTGQEANDPRYVYGHSIFNLLLTKTIPEYGPYELILAPHMNQKRALDGLKRGELIDAMFRNADTQREKDVLPIRYSVYKNLMGVRLFLIKKERQAEFSKVKSVEDLAQYSMGQGADWTDLKILRAQGFNVFGGSSYDGLFSMLKAGRFDLFPRSVAEIYEELEKHKDQGLAVESSLAIVYAQPSYILVNAKNKRLAERLEKGWALAIKDGSFEKLFLARFGSVLNRADLKNRRIFIIDNPLRSKLPTDDPLIP